MDSILLNKVIDGLEHCIKDKCDGCPYESDDPEVRCMENIMTDSLYLLTGRIQRAGHLVDWDAPHEI